MSGIVANDIRILDAYSDSQHVQTVRDLFREYEAFLDVDLCFQDFDAELDRLPGEYQPPTGAMLLALRDSEPAGCVAMRGLATDDAVNSSPAGDKLCEMKRMWVRAPYRSLGLGRRLASAIMQRARELGYARMCLDTLPKLGPAIALYRTLGFVERSPYYHNPLPGVLYLEARLRSAPGREEKIT